MRPEARKAALLAFCLLFPAGADAEAPANPLADQSPLPFHAPRFDLLKDGDFQPAIEAGMAKDSLQARAIADNPAAASFDNTILAQEKEGDLLNRATGLLQNLVQSNGDDALQKINQEEAPKLQAHADSILLNPRLFARVKALYDNRATLGLRPDQVFLIETYYRRFVHAGALLSTADKSKLGEINSKIADLQAKYLEQLQKASDAKAVVVSSKAELDGLSDSEIVAAADAARARKLDDKWLIVLRNTTQQPILASLTNRALRERILAASMSRGDEPGPTDLRDIISTLAQLRAQKAKLLGFADYSDYVISMQMAKTAKAARTLLGALAPAAVGKAKAEAAEIQALIEKENPGVTLTAADWEFYAGRVRKQKYNIDDAQVKPYFELNRVLQDGVFFAANKLYGLTFKERHDIPVYQPDVRVFEVFDADGRHLALFYADYFARPNKDGGAWCNFLNNPSEMTGESALIVNVANFTKPAAGAPALLSIDDVTTMFHEFGHALHAMFSVKQYPTEDGFNLPTDVIEFPSQFNEHWALDPSVFAHYALHYKTGAVMPQPLIDKIKSARKYGQGYAFTEILAASLLDLDWHSLPAEAPKQIPDQFEAASLKKNGVDLIQVPPRYRSPYFLHIWANGYDSNYYSYTWGEILDDDAWEWFQEHGGLTRDNGQRFRDRMLSPGYIADPMTQYRDFRGRDPNPDALARERGLK